MHPALARPPDQLQADADAVRLATLDFAHDPALAARLHELVDWLEEWGWREAEGVAERCSRGATGPAATMP